MSDQIVPPLKALLKIGYLCNYRCSFCHAETKKEIKEIAVKALFFKIHMLKKRGVQTILLSGGESTLEKHFGRIVDYIREQNMGFGIVTNGSTIYNNEFLASLYEKGIQNIYLSVHGYGEVHNTLVGDPKSFEKILHIIANIRDNYPKVRLFLNYVVVRQNIDSMEDTVIALKSLSFPGLSMKFSFLEPEGAGDNKDLMISPRVATGKIREIIQTHSSQSFHIYWDGFPLCFFADMLEKRADLQTENIKYITEIYEHTIFSTNYGNRVYTHACESCDLRDQCYGVFSKYRECFPEEELVTPIS